MSKISDCWQTPQWLFDQLNEQYGPFDVDLCAVYENAKCSYWGQNYLEDEITNCDGEPNMHLGDVSDLICFMNPPYSNPRPFIEKAWEDSKYHKIVCLVKVDTSTKWWGVFWEYGENYRCKACGTLSRSDEDYCCYFSSITKYNGPKPGCQVFFLPKRVKFDSPKGWEGKTTGPSFPSAVVIFDRRNV